jgi:hypothetical protein
MSLMKPMYLKIPNLLPPELSFRVLTEPAQVNALLAEQDWADQAASLKNRVNSRIKSQPLESWIEWEGYFTDKGSSRDLGIFGVLYYNGATYLRGIFVPDVPIVLAQKAANSLPEMLTHYLYSLGNKNAERKVN